MTDNFKSWVAEKAKQGSAEGYAFSNDLRAPALEAMKAGQFPTRKDEEWKYTPLKHVFDHEVTTGSGLDVDPNLLRPLKSAIPDAIHLIFSNGQFVETLSDDTMMINASSFGRRNNLGLGFPPCGLGVTVPSSKKPKPRWDIA